MYEQFRVGVRVRGVECEVVEWMKHIALRWKGATEVKGKGMEVENECQEGNGGEGSHEERVQGRG